MVPKRINSHLVLFDCITCDKCVPVCPNDANFLYETPPVDLHYRDVEVAPDGTITECGDEQHFVVERKEQIANFADFCNHCGNCDTFCPEWDGPYLKKPNFFGSRASFDAARGARRLLSRRRAGPASRSTAASTASRAAWNTAAQQRPLRVRRRQRDARNRRGASQRPRQLTHQSPLQLTASTWVASTRLPPCLPVSPAECGFTRSIRVSWSRRTLSGLTLRIALLSLAVRRDHAFARQQCHQGRGVEPIQRGLTGGGLRI